MSSEIGPITYGTKQEEIFLGREIAQHRDYSEKTAQQIDVEVHGIVSEAAKNARQIISKNIDALHRIAKALLEHETITGEDVDRLVNDEELAPKKQVNGAAKPARKRKTKSESEPKSSEAKDEPESTTGGEAE